MATSGPAAVPELPTVWRPGFARWTAYGVGVFLVTFFLVIAVTVDVPWSDLHWSVDRVGLVLIALATAYVLHRFGRVRVEADLDGLTIVNPRQRRRLAWAEVVAVRLAPGDPWLQLDLADGTTTAAVAIQSADGARGRRMAEELAACVAAHAGREPD